VLEEAVDVSIDCLTAYANISTTVVGNASLVHFPSGADMARTELENATLITLTFSETQSSLFFVFFTDATTARSLADAVKPSIETAFDTSFTWTSTVPVLTLVTVYYSGPGKTNLTEYTEWLMPQCLISDLGGFSLTFLPMTHEQDASLEVMALKGVGVFDWVYYMTIRYSTSIPTGSGNHRIDILELLNVSSLAPSPYANATGTYTSTVMLTIDSDETVSYVSCEPPGLVEPYSRGWWLDTTTPPETLRADFYFWDDPTPVSPLSFTFSGAVIPEFAALTLITALMLITAIALIVKKRLPKN